jgi:hypothetical protein
MLIPTRSKVFVAQHEAPAIDPPAFKNGTETLSIAIQKDRFDKPAKVFV